VRSNSSRLIEQNKKRGGIQIMRTRSHYALLLWVSAVLALQAGIVGCGHGYYRTYDPEYRDYHVWNNGEVGYYNRWETETHRDHKEYRDRNDNEKNEYWNWRHSH
jgi:hypothetical protein